MTMRFLVDIHHLGRRQTGNEVWGRNIAEAIERSRENTWAEVHYAVTDSGVTELPPSVGPERRHVVSRSSSRRLAVDLPLLVRRLRADALLVQYTLPFTRVPGVVMIHDLSFEDPQARLFMSLPRRTRLRISVRVSARRAAVILVPSRFTQAVLTERYRCEGSAVGVAAPALDPQLGSLLKSNFHTKHPTDAPHIVLCVGNVLPRKNLEVVADAVDRLRQGGLNVRMVVAGSIPSAGRSSAERIRRRLGAHVEFAGHVSTEELAQHYLAADVFCFPSLYEGFGIPLIEAMAAGTPVVASTSASLPEVGGDAAIYVAPDDPQGWADAIRQTLDEPGTTAHLVEAGAARVAEYRWADAARVTMEALGRAAASGRDSKAIEGRRP